MFGIVSSALFAAVNWIFRAVLIKAVLFSALFALTTAAATYLLGKIGPYSDGIGDFSSFPLGVLWLMHVVRLDVGLPAIFAAMGVAFAIRRLPLIG